MSSSSLCAAREIHPTVGNYQSFRNTAYCEYFVCKIYTISTKVYVGAAYFIGERGVYNIIAQPGTRLAVKPILWVLPQGLKCPFSYGVSCCHERCTTRLTRVAPRFLWCLPKNKSRMNGVLLGRWVVLVIRKYHDHLAVSLDYTAAGIAYDALKYCKCIIPTVSSNAY